MNHREIRECILSSLCGDDLLFQTLVLKGGNALSLVYGITERTSLDIDFSMQSDFDDPGTIERTIHACLRETFADKGYHLFDFLFSPRPKETEAKWWGGYLVEFKLISVTRAEELSNDTAAMQRQAITTDDTNQNRIYRIEISKYENIDPFETRTVNQTPIRVYSPVLLAVEKLRAIVQQHPEYPLIPSSRKRSRSRDFFDIHAICDRFAIDLGSHLDLVKIVFDAKRVPLDLLSRLRELHALHQAGWADVEASVSREIEPFDFYFAFVKEAADRLHSQRIVDAPR